MWQIVRQSRRVSLDKSADEIAVYVQMAKEFEATVAASTDRFRT